MILKDNSSRVPQRDGCLRGSGQACGRSGLGGYGSDSSSRVPSSTGDNRVAVTTSPSGHKYCRQAECPVNDVWEDTVWTGSIISKERAIFCYRLIRFLLQIGLWQEPAIQGGGGEGRLIFRTCSQRVAVGEVVLAGPAELGPRLLGPGHLECGLCVIPRVREATECQACPGVLGMLPGRATLTACP